MVESEADTILEGADKVDIAFLVVGDPFGYVPQCFCCQCPDMGALGKNNTKKLPVFVNHLSCSDNIIGPQHILI